MNKLLKAYTLSKEFVTALEDHREFETRAMDAQRESDKKQLICNFYKIRSTEGLRNTLEDMMEESDKTGVKTYDFSDYTQNKKLFILAQKEFAESIAQFAITIKGLAEAQSNTQDLEEKFEEAMDALNLNPIVETETSG